MVAVSTGTNNVFPSLVEPTLAGGPRGLVASGKVPLAAHSRRSKVVRVRPYEAGDLGAHRCGAASERSRG